MIRFTIRDVLWLTVLVAMGVAWARDRAGLMAECKRLDRRAEEAIGRDQQWQKYSGEADPWMLQ